MREIKFKFWNTLLKKMFDGKDIYELTDCRDEKHFGCYFDKKINIFLQFTGLQDVTGKDIYEGDIVLHDALPGAKNGLPIVFEDCKFIVKGKMESDNIVLGSHGRSMTVIGNIFET